MLRLSKMSKRDTVALVRYMSTLQQRGPGTSRVNTVGYESFTTLDPSRAYRHQHQLVAVDYQHREAMRLFLDSLHTAAANFRAKTATVAVDSLPEILREEPQRYWEQEVSVSCQAGAKKSLSEEGLVSESMPEEEPIVEGRHSTPLVEELNRDQHVALEKAVRRRSVRNSIRLFEEAVENDQVVPQKLVVSLFYLVVKKDPIMAYHILQYNNMHPDATDFSVDMYRRLCYSVSLLDPQKTRQGKIMQFVGSLLEDLDAMDVEVKKQVYPPLVVSLAKQRTVSVGPYAGVLYNFLVENDFKMTKRWLQSLLALSKYNRQEDLPFHDVLAQLVAIEAKPHPFSVLPAIQNMFPYTDSEKVCVALKAYRDLQRPSQDGDDGAVSLYGEHLIDLAALEMISAGAAHSGNSKLILLVWDVLEQCNYKPTEAIYENTIVAFAANPGHRLQQSFTAMTGMKEDGFEISRPLIRSISRAIRSNWRLVGNSLRLLTDIETPNNMKSLECFNVVMSAYAERGDVSQTVGILQTIKDHGLKPNGDSYSFAVEALGKDIHRRKKVGDRAWVHKNVEIADSILTMMEEDGVSPSADVVRNYVELLCIAKEVSTATSLVNDLISNGQACSINSKTLYRVALGNIEAGNVEKAKELASLTSERIPVLHRKIRSKEQRLIHLEGMRQRREKEHVASARDGDI